MLTENSFSNIKMMISRKLPYTITKRGTPEKRKVKIIGILFCPPQSPLGKSEVADSLPIFDHRADDYVDFFCAGYIPAASAQFFGTKEPVAVKGHLEWAFSAKIYSDLVNEIQNVFNWKCSGESELILVCASKDNECHLSLDEGHVLVFNLEQMLRDKAFTSVRAFFEQIFRFAKEAIDDNAVFRFSDSMGWIVAKESLRDAVLGILPVPLQDLYKKGRHFAVKGNK